MNKSKFLRKSLALLLSVLMVVAMIPVGASAANTLTDLAAIKVDGETVSESNKTFAAEVDDTTVGILVEGLKSDETAVLLDEDGEEANTVGGASVSNAVSVDLTDYANSGSVYTLPLKLTNDDGDTATYTVKLTVVAKKTTVELDTAVAYLTSGTDNKAIKTSINGKTINVQVPAGYTSGGHVELTAKDDATIDQASADLTDDTTVVVTNQAGTSTAVYTIKLTEVNVLSTMTIGGVAATIEHDEEAGREIEVTFDPSVLEDSKTTGKCAAEDFSFAYTALADAKISYDGTNANGTLKSGKTYDFTDGSNAFETGKKITVTYRGVSVDYALTLTTTEASDCTITEATVDGETATISGNKITANVAKGTSTAKVVLTTAETVTSVVEGSNTYVSNAAGVFYHEYTSTDDLKAGVIITVTAQDGTTKQYELKITATGDVNTAILTSFALKIGDETYTGTVSGTTVKVAVPYMTTDDELSYADVIATTNAYVGAYADSSKTTIENAADLGLTAFDLSKKTGTATGYIYAVGKYSEDVMTKYTITVTLENAKIGNTLSSVVATSASNVNALASDNTYSGSIKVDSKTKEGTITFKPSYSDYNSSSNLYVKSFATSNGGVAYLYDGNDYVPLSDLVLDSTYTYATGTSKFSANTTSGVSIIVVDEMVAREYENDSTTTGLTDGYTYTITTESQPARTGATLSNIQIGDTTIGQSLSGTVAYGVTAATETTPDDDYVFIDFSISAGATLAVTDGGSNSVTMVANGDTDGDGEAEEPSATNGALVLVRKSDGTVTVYGYGGTSSTPFVATKLVVTAEDGSTKNIYSIKEIKFAPANTEAKITAFSVAGTAGSIKADSDNNWTITVNAPLGTDVTSLVPTFTASAGATVANANGNLTSGESVLDFSGSVKLTVTSEDGGKANTYTVKVTVSDGFSDVKTTDWYYANVMAAYNANIVSGNGDGTFDPNASVTRRDFAIMVYKMMGSPATSSSVSFVDVLDGDYGATAIAYMKEHDIVAGDADTGMFRPGDTITRQEAACILANAKSLSGTTEGKFADDAKIASWASASVYACKAAGVFNGDENNNFNPSANITRAEAATVVYQASSK